MSAQVVELPISQRPPRVLTSDLSARLRAVNDARRALAAYGCRVVRQDIRQGTRRKPLLIVDQATPSLRCAVTGLLAERSGERIVFRAHFAGVELGWECLS
ncbi:MAG: hypothetical protein QJR02_10225 [Sinobacteraceae bacterium]|nr:hypothetical protein [Nevskiaceae bacterium]